MRCNRGFYPDISEERLRALGKLLMELSRRKADKEIRRFKGILVMKSYFRL